MLTLFTSVLCGYLKPGHETKTGVIEVFQEGTGTGRNNQRGEREKTLNLASFCCSMMQLAIEGRPEGVLDQPSGQHRLEHVNKNSISHLVSRFALALDYSSLPFDCSEIGQK